MTHQIASNETSSRDANAIVNRYKLIGLFGGLFLGGIVGIMVAGPHFHDWPAAQSGLIGYVAGEIALGSQASGPGSGLDRESGGGSGGGHGGTGGDD